MPPELTPSRHDLPQRPGDFATLTEALDYAAGGETGLNFHSGGKHVATLNYRQLREDARSLARKLLATGVCRGDRMALIAETNADFVRFFFASQYAGLIPVPLPASLKIGAHAPFVNQLKGLLQASGARLATASAEYAPFLEEAGEGLGLLKVGSHEDFHAIPAAREETLPAIAPQDTAFIQYTSGSTRSPKGVVIPHGSAMRNLEAIARHGVQVEPGDRCVSWLPFYHDMGLVGFLLVPLATQLSVDYMPTHEFAMRPGQWLRLIHNNRATISFSPCFGFDLCARRVRNRELEQLDLSCWRVAGVGAEMIRPHSLDQFAERLAPTGFDARAFLPCYGMAECTLAISFAKPGTGYSSDLVDVEHLHQHRRVALIGDKHESGLGRQLVHCGRPLPGFEVEIRDDQGNVLGDYQTGVIYLRGPGVMSGYFDMPDETREAIDDNGWLCTGDIGYRAGGNLTLTGRKKDLIIINGRNIWPQDLEQLCETLPEIRLGDTVAFSVPDDDQGEACVLLAQCRETTTARRQGLRQRLASLIRRELGLDCRVELVPPRSLPLTSSGKLSRARARRNFLDSFHEQDEALHSGQALQQKLSAGF